MRRLPNENKITLLREADPAAGQLIGRHAFGVPGEAQGGNVGVKKGVNTTFAMHGEIRQLGPIVIGGDGAAVGTRKRTVQIGQGPVLGGAANIG